MLQNKVFSTLGFLRITTEVKTSNMRRPKGKDKKNVLVCEASAGLSTYSHLFTELT